MIKSKEVYVYVDDDGIIRPQSFIVEANSYAIDSARDFMKKVKLGSVEKAIIKIVE